MCLLGRYVCPFVVEGPRRVNYCWQFVSAWKYQYWPMFPEASRLFSVWMLICTHTQLGRLECNIPGEAKEPSSCLVSFSAGLVYSLKGAKTKPVLFRPLGYCFVCFCLCFVRMSWTLILRGPLDTYSHHGSLFLFRMPSAHLPIRLHVAHCPWTLSMYCQQTPHLSLYRTLHPLLSPQMLTFIDAFSCSSFVTCRQNSLCWLDFIYSDCLLLGPV